MLSTQRCSVNAIWWLTGSRKYFHFEKNIFGETAEAGARLQPECAGNEESLIQSVDNALRNLTLMEWTKEDSHGKIWSQESLFFCVYLKWISFCICLKTHKEKTISGKKKQDSKSVCLSPSRPRPWTSCLCTSQAVSASQSFWSERKLEKDTRTVCQSSI